MKGYVTDGETILATQDVRDRDQLAALSAEAQQVTEGLLWWVGAEEARRIRQAGSTKRLVAVGNREEMTVDLEWVAEVKS